MTTLAATIASSILLIPNERHIDCSGWPDAADTELVVRIVSTDGAVSEATVSVAAGATVPQVRGLIWLNLNKGGWRTRNVGNGVLVVAGSTDAAVRSVEIKSDGWNPNVRWVPLVENK